MILLSKVFPTLDCASCISTPKMAASIHHPNVTTLTYSEVDGIEPDGAGRFQATPDHRLFVVCYASGTEAGGRSMAENRILEIQSDGSTGAGVRLPLTKPFTSYFTTTERGGSPPSRTLEMLGTRADTGNTISYARVRLF